MKTLEEIIERLPENIKLPIYEAFQVFQKDIIHRDLQEIRDEIKKVWQAINELAEMQRKTEQRVNELAEAQRKTEQRVNELAEAQKRTEHRVDKLEKVVQELAEAQRRTEEELRKLAESHYKLVEEHRRTRQKLEGLSDAFGYTLEDRAIKSLPNILWKEYRIKVIGKLKRTYLEIGKEYIEVNIYGKGRKNGKEYIIIGESKSRVSKKDIDRFIAKCEKISKKSIKVLISYLFTPRIEEYAKEKGLILIPSYELSL